MEYINFSILASKTNITDLILKWSNNPGHLVKIVNCHTEVKDDDRKETKKKFFLTS